MNERTLLGIRLPATGRTYDFWVPDDMQMQEVVQLVCQAMQRIEPAFFRYDGKQALMHMPTGRILDPHASIVEMGLSDGALFVVV